MPELATDAEAEIRRHGTETYPNECCGALIASGGTIVEAFPLPNTTAEGPRRRFLIGPNDYRLAEAARPGARRRRSPASIIRIPIIRPARRKRIWRRHGRI